MSGRSGRSSAGRCALRVGGRARRGAVLLGVLVVVTIGAYSGTTLVLSAQGEAEATDAALRRDQARALALAGVRAAMAELSEQRESLLRGSDPELTARWVLFTDELGREGVVRLAVLEEEGGGVALGEPARLDLNAASEEMLARLPGVGPTLAGRIVEARGSGFASVEELLEVEGVTPSLLYGEAGEGVASPAGAEGFEVFSSGAGWRLADLLTVFSFEPNVQMGLDDERYAGELRVNLDVPWSEELGGAIEDRFGREAAMGLQAMMTQQNQRFARDADVCAVLSRLASGRYELWSQVLDVVTTSDDLFRRGRVDVNRAPAAVLAAIPGLDEETAERIVSVREGLDAQQRRSVVWPLEQGVVEEAQFVQAADWLCTRSLQWRVRVEAGLAPPPDRAVGEGGPFGGAERLADRVVLEVVIDAASSRARLAYLRDLTLMDVARRLASEGSALEEDLGLAALDAEAEEAWSAAEAELAQADASLLSARGELEDDERQTRVLGRRAERRASPSPLERERRERPSRLSAFAAEREAARRPEGEEPPSEAAGGGERVMVDRRIGRWTSREGGW